AFKAAIVRGDPDDTAIAVAWAARANDKPATLPLGALKRDISRITSGSKIAYVVDAPFTPANNARIVALARDADVLFIEGGFRHADAAMAAQRGHLTAHQAGTLHGWRAQSASSRCTIHRGTRVKVMSWHMRPNSPSPGEKTNEADAVLEREGVQDQAERKYPAQRQSNHLRN